MKEIKDTIDWQDVLGHKIHHKAIKVINLMYSGAEPQWKCVYCGSVAPLHCYTQAEFEGRCCMCNNIFCDSCEKKKER